MFEIGNSLREARERQELEFPQIEVATKIRGKYLRALEEEHFEVLPAQTYVKGFLRSYAEYLGLDGQLYVDEFNSRYVVGEDEPPIRARRTARPHRRRRIQSNVLIAALVGIALVTALVIAAWKSGSPSNQNVVGAGPPVADDVHRPRQRRRRDLVRAVDHLPAGFQDPGRVVDAEAESEHRDHEGGADCPAHQGKVWCTSGRIWAQSGKTTLWPAANPSDV